MEEKRQHKRVYFSIDEDYVLEIESKESLKARLLSLSEGGISFFVPLSRKKFFKKDDIIFLKILKSDDYILVDRPVSLSVRYCMESHEGNKLIVGCKFLDLPEDLKNKVRKLVEEKADKLPF